MQIICEAKKLVAQKTDQCVERLEEAKEKLLKKFEKLITSFDKMITKAKNQRNKSDLQADNIESLLKENIHLLNNIEEKVKNKESTDCEVKNYHETVKGIIENNKKKLSGARLFEFPVFDEDKEISTEMTPQQITSEKFVAVMPDEDIKAEETQNRHLNAFQLQCRGT